MKTENPATVVAKILRDAGFPLDENKMKEMEDLCNEEIPFDEEKARQWRDAGTYE